MVNYCQRIHYARLKKLIVREKSGLLISHHVSNPVRGHFLIDWLIDFPVRFDIILINRHVMIVKFICEKRLKKSKKKKRKAGRPKKLALIKIKAIHSVQCSFPLAWWSYFFICRNLSYQNQVQLPGLCVRGRYGTQLSYK